MYNPIRGGTRGGQGDFKWSEVSADKDRENYLGHSINAPTGRWQKNQDVHWYNRDKESNEADRLEEIRRIKEAEEDALAVALGFQPNVRGVPGSVASGANATPGPSHDPESEAKKAAKEERRKAKAAKREARELKRSKRHHAESGASLTTVNRHGRSRSRSPRQRSRDVRSRSRSPPSHHHRIHRLSRNESR